MIEERRPTREELVPLLSRAMELAGAQLAPDTVRSVAEVFQVLFWHFVDYDLKAYLVIGDTGDLSFVTQAPREPDGKIKIEADMLHDVAFGKVPIALAFLGGKLRLQGLPALKLRRFIPLFNPFLEGYRQACQELREGKNGQVLP
jgi:hypothetical protein